MKSKMCQCRVTLLATIILLFVATRTDSKDLHGVRRKSLSHADLLKEYSETALSSLDSDSSVVSWTGVRLPSTASSVITTTTVATKHHKGKKNHHQRTSIKKTKSGLIIERNVASFGSATGASAPADLELSASMVPAAPTSRRTKPHQHRRRGGGGGNGGRGQRQKMNKNALRLLSGQTETIEGAGAFPPLFNVAPRAAITVNATCGQSGREEYCKLVDAYPHKKWAKQCGICNAQSSDVDKQRPIEAILSNTNIDDRWWQSPTLQYGRHFEYVTITLDLKQVYQVFFVMLKSANSPRPASWILEKSLDGANWQPWQYFGLSDADCRRRYNLEGQNGKYVFANDTEVICTTQFSKALPLENGELHVSLLKNRPGAMEQSQVLMDFITARYIRIRLQGMHSTVNLDNSVDWLLDSQSLEKRSFYSLKQIRISARLDCHGHAEKTTESEADEKATSLACVCQHNTCGADCSTCCPLFKDKPFRNGTAREQNACEVCQCNGHAQLCVYDEFLEKGICQKCENFTAGNECEFCLAGYFRERGSSLDTPCVPCNCSQSGSTGSCHPEGGQCTCRDGFEGGDCDECAPGYYGKECQRCICDTRGTLPGAECEEKCLCKSFAEGDSCSGCAVGYYALSVDNPEGCTKCYCSGVGLSCASAALQTLAFETLNDWKVTDITRSLIAHPTLDSETNNLVFGMYDMTDLEAIYWLAPQGYTGNKLTSYGSRLSLHVSWVVIRGDTSGKPTSGPNVILFGKNGMKIAVGDREYAATSSAVIDVILQEDGWYHVPTAVKDIVTRQRRTEYHGDPVTRTQFMSVLANVESILIRGAYHTDQVESILERATIYSGGTELGSKSTTLVEQCVCPPGYTGLSCEGCEFGYIRVYENTTDHQLIGKCIPCPCNGHSNSCNLKSGSCGDCMHNTYGERCERCKVGFYGNPMQGTATDCRPCACPLLEDSNNFSPSCQLKSFTLDMNRFGVTGNSEYVCTQCPQGYTGDHCEMCDDGYYGKPTEIGSQCLPCLCDGGPCDVFTGECITCHGNTEGWHCERCKMGYWGDPAVGCEPCDCYVEGADSGVCDSTDGQCLCKPRFSGQKCDACDIGYADIDLKCLECECYVNGSRDEVCNPYNGQCDCKPGVMGLKCEECEEQYYGLNEVSDGCEVGGLYYCARTTSADNSDGLAFCSNSSCSDKFSSRQVSFVNSSNSNSSSSVKHAEEIVQNDAPSGPSLPLPLFNQKRKIRRKFPPKSSSGRLNPSASGISSSRQENAQRFKGKRRRYPLQQQQRPMVAVVGKLPAPRSTPRTHVSSVTTTIASPAYELRQQQQIPKKTSTFHRNVYQHRQPPHHQQHTTAEQTTTLRITTSYGHRTTATAASSITASSSLSSSLSSSSSSSSASASTLNQQSQQHEQQPQHQQHLQHHYINGSSRTHHHLQQTSSHHTLLDTTTIHNKKDHLVIRENTDIVVYRNIEAIPCPPSVRIVPHRFIPVPAHQRPRARECQCSQVGAITLICEKRSGQCPCLSNVTGRRCDKCRAGHWNLTAGVGCLDCRCDPAGSRSAECNPWTGQCDCKIGVGGQRCNECTDGFYGFSADGCTRCERCPTEGQVCDPINGRCVCPPNSRGLGCSQCLPGTWGWQKRVGCRNCDCDHVGSIGQVCDGVSGQCVCREGYSGRTCETCAVGYFGYPECRRCNCDQDGSFVRADGLIACDANGQCPCKSLVVGLKCDTCMQSTFGLSALNPEGCTRCFCFGRSDECTQSEWSWGHIRMPDARNLSVQFVRPLSVPNTDYEYIFVIQMEGTKSYREDAEINVMNNLNLIPKSTGNVSIGAYTTFFYPLYFQLPPLFYGDRTSSYGGNLVFTLLTEGARSPLDRKVLHQYPLVQIHSHTKLVLDFYEYEEREFSANATYRVPLHESFWKYHHNGQDVDRSTLMAALQNIRHIFLRGTSTSDFTQVVIQNVHMDSAIYVFGSTNMIAKGVEKCKCPKRYDGLSCQDPGRGFYRWRNSTEIESMFLEDLIGRSAPCHCNGRSSECDRETGVCLNCRDNSGGDHCEQCAEGYYGDPNVNGCKSCPCPETSRNFAKGCTVWKGEVSCICRPGYTGPLCDRCRSGYFGSPRTAVNGTCQSCDCNLDGIVSDECNELTGQCNCRPGVTGRKCDTCLAERHFLEDRRCKLCDNCTLILLDYAELIGNKLRRGLAHVDLTGIPAPWIKLEEYEFAKSDLSERLQDYTNARQMLANFDLNSLAKLDSYAENTKFQSRKCVTTASKRSDVVDILHNEASVLFVDVGAIRADTVETIFTLNNYGTQDHHLNLPTALEQAKFYLNSIAQHDQSVENMRTTWQCAWDQFYFFGNSSDAAFDQQGRVEMFWRDLNQTNYRLSDARRNTDKTFEMLNEIDDIHEHIVNLKSYLVEDYGQIRELYGEVTQLMNHSLVPETDVCVEMNEDHQDQLGNEIETIVKLGTILNATMVENEVIHREVRKHWLPKAEKHASHLMDRSNEYTRQFQPTKNGARIALLASSAHKNISEAIAAARRASIDAKERVSAAQMQLYPTDGSSVIERAKISLAKSKFIQKNALQEMQKSNVLKTKIKVHEDKVEGIKSKILEAGIRTNNISSGLAAFSAGNARKFAQESIDMAARVSEQMRTENRKAVEINADILKLRDKFAMLEPDWEIKLGMAEENISLTKTNIRLANISLTYVEDQTMRAQQKFDAWNSTMSKQLQELKDKIAKARHAAEGIKVSLESLGPKCIRTYLPSSYGLSTSNSIKLSFALNNRNGNSPLIYMQGRDGRYISLELYKRRVRLIWSLGGSTEIITHPLEIQTRDPKYDDAWYHVEANRTLNIGSLLVRRMTNFGKLANQAPVTGYTDSEYTRFFRTTTDRIWLGGYPAETRSKDLQVNPGLNVVVHNVEVDNKPMGIWNFAHTEGRCGGAMLGAQESSSSSNARHFNGLGYAEVKKSRPRPYRKNMFALQMTFRTLDENALLFLAVDDKNNRSVSVTLSRGRIMFRIDYGDESKLEINTTKKYNTGNWVKIEAAREFVPKRGTENGSLRVNNDSPITGSPTVPIKSHMLPDLSKPVYYLGGVPPGFKSGTTKAPGADNPFLGCMMDVQVNGETYDPLESSSYFGVEQSCKDTITKAGFNGNGYIELPSQSLRKRSNTGFVFRTLQPNCLLLLSAYPPEVRDDYDAKDIKGNYSISLLAGQLHVWVDSGRSSLRMTSNTTLNDGEFHVVNLIKNGRKLELMIDDELQVAKSLNGTPTLVSMPRDAGGLYIGGAPPYEEYTPLAPTFIALEGAIRDVVFNNRTINFNQALAFSNVQIGRTGPQMGSYNGGMLDVLLKTEPIGKSFTAAPEGCHRVGSYSYESNAFKFGDAHISYAQVNAPYRNFWQRNFHIEFDFRSFYPNGLIFLAPGTKEKHKHYVSLLLKDGQLMLVIRGRRREELNLTAKLNDGEWHHVTIACQDRKVTMSVEIGTTDQKTSAQMKVPKKISASNLVYVGGLPEITLQLPSELISKLEGFKGCIRKMNVNNTTQDLARPGKHMNVGQCFPKVERGSYFPGDAYAIYKKNFHVGKYLELEMEFRTSELNGILLSVSEPVGFPALSLEIHNGNIIFSCDMGDGNPFRVESILPSKYAVCDNKWHNISALYDFEQIALRIDQNQPTIGLAQHRVSGKVQTKSALFIGGIPDIAPSGALLSRENFKGCIRNVSIRNERRDWIDMDGLHNVLLSECLVVN